MFGMALTAVQQGSTQYPEQIGIEDFVRQIAAA
jgi:hypothetical protein